jgi:hypothetical protein
MVFPHLKGPLHQKEILDQIPVQKKKQCLECPDEVIHSQTPLRIILFRN